MVLRTQRNYGIICCKRTCCTVDEDFKKELDDRLTRIEKGMSLLLTAIVVRQKDACEIAEVSPDTPRNRHRAGKLNVLSRDGSRLKYLTLADVGDLKPRRP